MAMYHEDGCVMDVDIIADKSDSEFERYELKINSIVKPHPFCRDPEIGSVFTADKAKGVSCNGLWTLFK